MKITIPKSKKPVKFVQDATLYVVICQYRCDKWGVADHFSEDFASNNYLTATKFKKRVIDKLQPRGWWKKKHFKIAKITL